MDGSFNMSATPTTPKAGNVAEAKEIVTPGEKVTRVRNPFEQAMVDRLHLPIIESPSLFQIPPQTPQMSSTVFEWTIDDVSSLKPVHLEPHETQFQDSPDPDLEAKAQSAISSYFKEQVIVPSPINCPLRRQRIILNELNSVTPIAKNKSDAYARQVNRCSMQTQTELSIPPYLSPEAEKVFAKYMRPPADQPGSSTPGSFSSDDMQQSLKRNTLVIATEAAAKDISLRRKLFDKHNIVLLDNSVSSWQMSSSPTQNHKCLVGVLSDSMDKSSNCSLSPISATGGFSSPDDPSSFRKMSVKRKAPDFRQMQDIEDLSPISRPSPSRRMSGDAKRQKGSFMHKYRTSMELSDLSAISHCDETDMQEASVLSSIREQQENLSLNNHVLALKMEQTLDENQQDLSGNSAQSSNDSELSNTPRCAKRGKTKTKNLSQSFSAYMEDDEEHNNSISQNLREMQSNAIETDTKDNVVVQQTKEIVSFITGCDSGFNEKENCATIDD